MITSGVAVGQAVHRRGHRTLDGVLQRDQRGVGVPRPHGGQRGGDTRLGVPGSLRGGNCTDERGFGEGTLGPEIGEPRRRRLRHPTRVVRAGRGERSTRGKLPRNRQTRPVRPDDPVSGREVRDSRPARRAPDAASRDLSAVLLRLLGASVREEPGTLLPLLEDAGVGVRRGHRAALDHLAARARRPPGADRERRPTRPRSAWRPPARRWTSASRPPTPRWRWPTSRTSRSPPTTSTPPMLLAVDASLLSEGQAAGHPVVGTAPGAPLALPHPRRPRPRGTRGRRTRCAGSTSPRRCASPPTCGGCACCRPSSTPSWPRRCAGAASSTGPGSSPSRRSPARSRPAS